MPNLVLKPAKMGCEGCYYDKLDDCPNQLACKPWIKSADERTCCSAGTEMIFVEEETECSS